MEIRMLETRRGCEDGFVVKRYLKGEVYKIGRSLAVAFVNQGWAETV